MNTFKFCACALIYMRTHPFVFYLIFFSERPVLLDMGAADVYMNDDGMALFVG
jgi:hypothetical protein